MDLFVDKLATPHSRWTFTGEKQAGNSRIRLHRQVKNRQSRQEASTQGKTCWKDSHYAGNNLLKQSISSKELQVCLIRRCGTGGA